MSGDSGKTLVSLGLTALLREAGMEVHGYKKGPDYIDAAWLAGTYGGTPAVAFRSYDESRRVWTGWPTSVACPDGARLERAPGCWATDRSSAN